MEKILMEMLEATRDAYKEMVKREFGSLHGGRCNDAIVLTRLLVDMITMLKPQITIDADTTPFIKKMEEIRCGVFDIESLLEKKVTDDD